MKRLIGWAVLSSILFLLSSGPLYIKILYLILFILMSLLFVILPKSILSSSKYPLLLLVFLFSAFLSIKREMTFTFLYPLIPPISLYVFLLYLSTFEEKEKAFFKELLGLSLLSLSLFLNLYYTGMSSLFIPFFVTVICALFITERTKNIPFILLYMVLFSLFSMESLKSMNSNMKGWPFRILLTCSIMLTSLSLLDFLRSPDFPKRFAFFGSLFLSITLIFFLFLKIPISILSKRLLLLFLLPPIAGFMLKEEHR